MSGRQVDIPEPKPGAENRLGGQTDYVGSIEHDADSPAAELAKPQPRKYENRFIDMDVQPVPVAVQEDRALLVYDYVQKQYNVNLAAGVSAFDGEIDVVEDNANWLIERIALFGTATGNMLLSDGSSADRSTCFAVQAGVASVLGGAQSITGLIMSPRTPLRLTAIGVDNGASLAIGIWYRKCRWVWTPQRGAFLSDK